MKKITLLFIGIFGSIISAYSNDNFTLQSLNDDTYSIRFNLNEIELEQRGSYTKIIANTKLISYLMGATTTQVGAGDIVIFDYRVWHRGTPARAVIERGLVYHHDSIQVDLPVEKTTYVF